MFLSRFVRIIPLIISKIIPISRIHFFFVYLWVLLESIYYHFFDTISDINYNKRLFFSLATIPFMFMDESWSLTSLLANGGSKLNRNFFS